MVFVSAVNNRFLDYIISGLLMLVSFFPYFFIKFQKALVVFLALVVTKRGRFFLINVFYALFHFIFDGQKIIEQVADFFDVIIQLQPEGKDVLVKALKGSNPAAVQSDLFLDPATLLIKDKTV